MTWFMGSNMDTVYVCEHTAAEVDNQAVRFTVKEFIL